MQLRGGPVLGENGRAVGIREPVDLGPTQDLGAYEVDMTVARRKATADELARLGPGQGQLAIPMHRPRPTQNPRSWRNYRSVMGDASPAPSLTEEPHPMTTATPEPPAIPCGSCLHADVCFYRRTVEDEVAAKAGKTFDLRPGVHLVDRGVTVECDHHLPVMALRETTADRMAAPAPDAMLAARGPVGATGSSRRRVDAAAICEALRANGGNQARSAVAVGLTGPAFRERVRTMLRNGDLPPDVASILNHRTGRPKAVAS